MNQDEFAQLIMRLETQALQHPGLFLWRAGLTAVLGYLYLGLLLLPFVLVILALVVSQPAANWPDVLAPVLLFIVLPLWVIGSALRVPGEQIEGVPPTATEAAPLRQLIDEVAATLHADRPRAVLLTGAMGVGLAEVAHWGLFGGVRHTLQIGVGTLCALSPEALRARVAVALGLLAWEHRRVSAWVAAVALYWDRLLKRLLDAQPRGAFLFRGFARWYTPLLQAHVLVLWRLQTIAGDQAVAAAIGKQAVAEALLREALADRYLDSVFWPKLGEQARQTSEPPANLYAEMQRALREDLPPDDASTWLTELLAQHTMLDDVAPTLADRLYLLDYVPAREGGTEGLAHALAVAPVTTAGEALFGAGVPALLDRLGVDWQERFAEEWQHRYTFCTEADARLGTLEGKATADGLTEDECWERVRLLADRDGEEAAITPLQELLARFPHHVSANFFYGKLLLAREDATGVGYLETAMERDPWCVLESCLQLYDYFQRHGQTIEAELYRQRAEGQQEALAKAEQERAVLTPQDALLPHGQEADAVATLRAKVEQVATAAPEILRVYLVQKTVTAFPEHPCYFLVVVVQAPLAAVSTLGARIVEEVQFACRLEILILDPSQRSLERKVERVPGALVYTRAKTPVLP